MVRLLRAVFFVCVALLVAGYAFVRWSVHDPHPAIRLARGTLAVRDATVYSSPDEPPLLHASILVRDGRIAAVGQTIDVPSDAQTIACDRCVVTAGFWNAHVHFTQARWTMAALRPAATLDMGLADMLTSRGFTTVVDVGSNPFDTLSLRRRIETGNLLGPYIYTSGPAQYPPHGLPFYLRNTLPKIIQKLSPQPENPEEAARTEETNIARGADVLKLFTGSYVEHDRILPMPLENARAAVAVAHRHGQLAFAHPSDLEGVLVARDSGVDILAHAADTTEGVSDAILQSLIDRHMAMVPTLKMFGTTVTHNPTYLNPIYDEVGRFDRLGGTLLFGTDVGYMTDYTTQDEFVALAHSGLDYRRMLRMLTTAPAERFGVQTDKGRVAVGQLADLVILGSDPAENIAAFSDVRTTIRSGRVIYRRP